MYTAYLFYMYIYIYTVYIRYTLVDPENNNSPQKIGLACFSCASDSLFSVSSSCRIGQKKSNGRLMEKHKKKNNGSAGIQKKCCNFLRRCFSGWWFQPI